MKRPAFGRRLMLPLLALSLLCTMTLPVSAFFWNKKNDTPSVPDFSKNGLVGEVISFTDDDFAVKGGKDPLTSITVVTLPDPKTGMLTIGGQPLTTGTVIDASALSGLRFQILPVPAAETVTFTFRPDFASGTQGGEVTVTLHLLKQANQPPIARNMELSTYKNVSITGYFDAVDTEGDVLTFQLTSTPARGAVNMAEDGSSKFVYSPYENKTGKDTFTYVAVDPAGNTSPEATVSVRIDKADTKVTYADLDGDASHKAAIRLAEDGVYVGASVDGKYFFRADEPVSRAEFLSMAMAIADLAPLDGVTMTGFSDDLTIPTWAKGSVSAALKAGAVQGRPDETGAYVFGANEPVTLAEASVMLDRLLSITDVPAEVFAPQSGDGHWAGQAAANLAASGVIRPENASPAALSASLTRGETAQLLDGALDVLAQRESGGIFPW